MSGLQVLAPSEEVGKAGLMRRLLETAIRHPPIPHQHAGEVGTEHCRRLVEPRAVADGVDGRLRRGERPQPVAERVHPPAGLIRRDHRIVAHLLAQRRIRGRRRGGCAVQKMDEAARGHRQCELGPENAGDLLQRHAQLGVQLDDQPRCVRTQLHSGRAQRVRRLQAVSALHPPLTLRAVTHLDVEAAHERPYDGQLFLITAAPHGPPQPRRRSPDTSSAPAPHTSRQPVVASGGTPVSRTPRRFGARDAGRFPAAGPWQRGLPAVCPRAAPPPTPSPDARCDASTGPAPRPASPFLVRTWPETVHGVVVAHWHSGEIDQEAGVRMTPETHQIETPAHSPDQADADLNACPF